LPAREFLNLSIVAVPPRGRLHTAKNRLGRSVHFMIHHQTNLT
jgi:hypothetical protein